MVHTLQQFGAAFRGLGAVATVLHHGDERGHGLRVALESPAHHRSKQGLDFRHPQNLATLPNLHLLTNNLVHHGLEVVGLWRSALGVAGLPRLELGVLWRAAVSDLVGRFGSGLTPWFAPSPARPIWGLRGLFFGGIRRAVCISFTSADAIEPKVHGSREFARQFGFGRVLAHGDHLPVRVVAARGRPVVGPSTVVLGASTRRARISSKVRPDSM